MDHRIGQCFGESWVSPFLPHNERKDSEYVAIAMDQEYFQTLVVSVVLPVDLQPVQSVEERCTTRVVKQRCPTKPD